MSFSVGYLPNCWAPPIYSRPAGTAAGYKAPGCPAGPLHNSHYLSGESGHIPWAERGAATYIDPMGTLTAVLALLLAAPAIADTPRRPFPDHCLAHVPGTEGGATPEAPPEDDADRLWNTSYREGFRAIEAGDYPTAEREMCRALFAAGQFGPRDWRFAETLDELGLIAFQFGELERAEQMQGAAVAEMLLAVGPSGEPPHRLDASQGAVMGSECGSGVRVYTERLGWVFERLPGNRSVEELHQAPWRVFSAGYLPLDADLARRLEWLISRYLLLENLAAAETLTGLQREIAGE